MKCPNPQCNTNDYEPDAKFCHACGHSLQPIDGSGTKTGSSLSENVTFADLLGGEPSAADLAAIANFAQFVQELGTKTGTSPPPLANVADVFSFFEEVGTKMGVPLSSPDAADFARFLLGLGVKAGVAPPAEFLHAVLTEHFTVNKIKVFAPPALYRHPSGLCFYQRTTRFINFRLHFTRTLNTSVRVTYHWEIVLLDKAKEVSVSGRQQAQYTIDAQSGFISFRWKNVQQGNWGLYAIHARIENSNTIEAMFVLL